MTESEAIEKLRAYHKCQRLQVKGIYEDCNEKLCDNCDLCYAQGNTGEHIKSIEIAIQALEKQIPKKPNKAIDSSWGTQKEAHTCPVCDYYLTEVHFIEPQKIESNKKITYCETCGQAIDWSDEE